MITVKRQELQGIRNLSYKIVNYLIDNNEEVWKLLYYSGDTINKPNLSKEQKINLISKNSYSDTEGKKIFFTRYTSDAEQKAKTQLRLQIYGIQPEDSESMLVTILFQCIVDNQEATLQTDKSSFDNRALAIAQNIVGCLNGAIVSDGTTGIFFNAEVSGLDNIYLTSYGEKFSGYDLYLSTWLVY